MSLYDKELIKRRFAKHLDGYNKQSTTQLEICKKLQYLINSKTNLSSLKSGRAYEIGAGTGFLTSLLLEDYSQFEWYVNDMVEQTKRFLNNIFISSAALKTQLQLGDAEVLPYPEDLSIIASASAVQWFDSLEGFISKSSNSLQQGGYLAFSTFGEDNFLELSTLFGESAIKYYSLEQIELWAENNSFDLIHSESYKTSIYFDSPQDAIRYIKETGINASSTKVWSKSSFEEFCQRYVDLFSRSDGMVSLTFNPMIFIFQKR